MLDLRKIFDKYRIVWKDRGPNTSQGNINIRCPQCGLSDPSYHLAVAEDGSAYYCFRNPGRHSGRSLAYLFKLLDIPLSNLPTSFSKEIKRTEKKVERNYSLFRHFQPAKDDPEALLYLYNRGFLSPEKICEKFDLRVDKRGEWAGRLIIPLTVGWTGRSMRPHIHPRYDAYTDNSGFFLYSNNSSSAILHEGPLDGIRLGYLSSQFDYIGKCGNRLSPTLIYYLRQRCYINIYNLPDGDVNYIQHNEDTRELATYCTKSRVVKVDLPDGRKDPAEIPESEARRWLLTLG